jgi:4-amino-4-deoxy-L-arabinose transferase-like glycosyltransferase
VIWAVFIFAFFSKSNSKLIPYILPIFPALSLLVANAFSRSFDEGIGGLRPFGWAAAVVLTLAGAGGILYPHLAAKPQLTTSGATLLGLLCLGGGVAASAALRRRSAVHLFLALAAFSLLLEICGPPVILARIVEKKSPKKLALMAAEHAGKETVIASFGLRQGLSFYTKRRVVVVGDPNEITFGSRQGDNTGWFMDVPQFLRLWEERHVVLLLNRGGLDELRRLSPIPPRELAQQGKLLLVTNR